MEPALGRRLATAKFWDSNQGANARQPLSDQPCFLMFLDLPDAAIGGTPNRAAFLPGLGIPSVPVFTVRVVTATVHRTEVIVGLFPASILPIHSGTARRSLVLVILTLR